MRILDVLRVCAAASVLSCLALTSCTPNQSGASTSTAPSAAAPSSLPASTSVTDTEHNYLGTNARQLAAMIPGCDNKPPQLTVEAVASDAPSLKRFGAALAAASSASECVLRGYAVIVFAFASTQDEATNTAALSRADDYYADGRGWSAAPTSTSVAETERSVVQPVALTLDGEVLSGRATRAAVSETDGR
jgi:hypothetical protein